jgi:hypothetical protein
MAFFYWLFSIIAFLQILVFVLVTGFVGFCIYVVYLNSFF